MFERISLGEEPPRISDERALRFISEKLREDFLFMPLENFIIEVRQDEAAAVRERIQRIKQHLFERAKQKAPR